MIETLTSILDLIVTLVKFVINTLTSLFTLISQLPSQLSFITTSIASLPQFLIPYALTFVSITVITYLVGRKVN